MKIIVLFLTLVILVSCDFDKSYESFEVKKYKAEHTPADSSMGQVTFVFDSLGALSLRSLMDTNILPLKIYGTAFLMMENDWNLGLTGLDLPLKMEKFGFIRPTKIANWNTTHSSSPKIKSLGFVSSQIEDRIMGVKVSLEVAGITCAACHSSVTYDSKGNPTKEAWLGQGNSSLDYDGFLQQVYEGLKIGMTDSDKFMENIKSAYPNISSLEQRTIRRFILPKIRSALKDFKQMDRVLPFPNGGPGHTNGLGAFKRNAKLLENPFEYNSKEAGIVEIPSLMDKNFRSSLLADGAYAVIGQKRFEKIDRTRAFSSKHVASLGEMATFFSYAAMGVPLNNIEGAIPKIQTVFSDFVASLKPQKYPGNIDPIRSLGGARIYQQSCSECHGTYSDDYKLQSLPNRLVLQRTMGTDDYRWRAVDKSVAQFADETVFSKHTVAGHTMGGYVAPVLTGVWAKAPYFHNGSVPTLWQLMNPELRPKKFQVGGHALDLIEVGIKGSMNAKGIYAFDKNYQAWTKSSIFNTNEPGKSNKGHEKEFDKLSETEKRDLLEFLKNL